MNVSVALATYNGERFLREQLDSIAQQTLRPSELVVSDDASSDNTVSIVREFAADAPFPVEVRVNEHALGAGENFMRAAFACTSDLVAFSDQDDVWTASKVQRCVDAFDDPTIQLVIHGWTVVDDELNELERVSPGRDATKWGQAPGMAMIFRRELLDLLPWNERPPSHEAGRLLLHDEWIYGLARVAGRIAFVDEQLCLYRQHAGNVEGAPDRSLGAEARRVGNVGRGYYARRAEQARAWAALLREVSPEEAVSYARLESALRARAAVYDGPRRVRALGRALRSGTYRPRSREGFGLRGLVRDSLNVVRPGG